MKVLIADDDIVSRRVLEVMVARWGYEVIAAGDGATAWQHLEKDDAPEIALLDWVMPGIDGLEVCQRARAVQRSDQPYLIILSARTEQPDILAGFEAGADDYLGKPIEQAELQARIRVGSRIVTLQRNLTNRVRDLGEALGRVRQLHGLLPICSYCKKIRNDQNYWQQVEAYLSNHSDVRFSHGICPDCFEKHVKPELEQHGIPGLEAPPGGAGGS
jgi:sigma-B regulation protein RsbU (phosphoserine phosphatase)